MEKLTRKTVELETENVFHVSVNTVVNWAETVFVGANSVFKM